MPEVLRFSKSRDYAAHLYDTIRRPIMQIRLWHGAYSTPKFYAIVDSGADYSQFHESVAKALGINASNCDESEVQGIGGAAAVKICDVHIEIDGHRFRSPARFDSRLPSNVALLGREDVFAQYVFAFDQNQRRLFYQRSK